MKRMTAAEKQQRAETLSRLAAELVTTRGNRIEAKKGDQTIGIMAYEGSRIAVLYKTPDVDLTTPNVPHRLNPKDFMLDVWLDGHKRMSLQWGADAEKDVLLFKPGGWEEEAAREISLELNQMQPNC